MTDPTPSTVPVATEISEKLHQARHHRYTRIAFSEAAAAVLRTELAEDDEAYPRHEIHLTMNPLVFDVRLRR